MNILEWAKKKKSDFHIWYQRWKVLSGERKYKDKKSFMERDMLLLAHSLEKGMGIQNPRRGYGTEKASTLVNLLRDYSIRYCVESFPFLESIAVLDKYLDLMKEQKVSVDSVAVIRNNIRNYDCQDNYCKSGYEYLSHDDVNAANYDAFKGIISSRHSIRHYSKDVIKIKFFNNL